MSHVTSLVSSCCEDEVQEHGGCAVCAACGKKCDAITPFSETAEGRTEAAAEYWMDSERNGD
jgi:hypothetical protein